MNLDKFTGESKEGKAVRGIFEAKRSFERGDEES
jgi:hypothetical protein